MTPLILADNRFLDATPTATGTAAGYDVLNIRDGRPYTFWLAAAAGTNYLTVNCGTAAAADTLGIISHNLGTAAASVSVESSVDGVTWGERLAPFVPTDDRALLKLFTTSTKERWRLKIVTATVAPYIAVVLIGVRLQFPVTPDAPFTPFVESVEEEAVVSKTGNALGTVVRYFPVEIKPAFTLLTRTWVESTYRPFREQYGRWRSYFFWAWDLTTYPSQVFYVKDNGKYDPTVSVLSSYDKLKLELKGISEP